MIRINRTVPDRNRGTGHSVDAEQLEPDRSRDYIDDRVDRPDLVKMYVFELRTVDLRFRPTEHFEDREGPISNVGSKLRPRDQIANLRILSTVAVRAGMRVTVSVLMSMVIRMRMAVSGRALRVPVRLLLRLAFGFGDGHTHIDITRCKAVSINSFHDELKVETEGRETFEQRFPRQTEVEQGAHKHVPGSAGECVEMKNALAHKGEATRPAARRQSLASGLPTLSDEGACARQGPIADHELCGGWSEAVNQSRLIRVAT